MALLYIGTEGSTLSVDGTHCTLRHNGKRIGRIPPSMIDEVIIEDGIEISRKALDRLGNTGVSVTFMGREGEINARLVAPWAPRSRWRTRGFPSRRKHPAEVDRTVPRLCGERMAGRLHSTLYGRCHDPLNCIAIPFVQTSN